MRREVHCSSCGQTIFIDDDPDLGDSADGFDAAGTIRTVETMIPHTIVEDEDSPGSPGGAEIAPVSTPIEAERFREHPSRPVLDSEEFPVSEADPIVDVLARTPSGPTPLEVLNVEPSGGLRPASLPEKRIDRRPSGRFGSVFLPSYASAVTIALIWMWMQGRDRREPPAELTVKEPSRPRFGVSEVPGERIAAIGESLTIGDLSIKAERVEVRRVQLVSRLKSEGPRGGGSAYRLTLRVRNLNPTESFQPLKPDDVREPDRGEPAGFIEAGEWTYPLYPLARTSEWAIRGESFPTLEPGTEAEIAIFSAPEAVADAPAAMVWRFRVHDGPGPDPDRSETIGIRVDERDLSE